MKKSGSGLLNQGGINRRSEKFGEAWPPTIYASVWQELQFGQQMERGIKTL